MSLSKFMRYLKLANVLRVDKNEAGGSRIAIHNQSARFKESCQLSFGLIGDSLNARNDDWAAGYYGAEKLGLDSAYSNYGWFTWLLGFSGANIKMYMYAVNGSTSESVINNQLTAAVAGRHDIYAYIAGINDINGEDTVGNASIVVDSVVQSGGRLILMMPPPTATFTSSRARFTGILTGLVALATKYPLSVRFVNLFDIDSDPALADGTAYASVFDNLKADGTHENTTGAAYHGYKVYKAIEDWLMPSMITSAKNGMGVNKLVNSALGGTAGTITSAVAGSNSVAPDSWTIGRGSANVTYAAYKARAQANRFVAGLTYPVGARIYPQQRNGFHYIVLTSAVAGATPPGASNAVALATPKGAWSGLTGALATPASVTHNGFVWVLTQNVADVTAVTPGVSNVWMNAYPAPFSRIQPNATGPVYLVVPENDWKETPMPEEQVIIDMSSSSAGASDYVWLTQNISVAEGDKLSTGVFIDPMDSDYFGFALRVTQQVTAGGAEIAEHAGMGPNGFIGTTYSPTLIPFRREKIWVPTPEITIQPTVTSLRFAVMLYARANGGNARYAVSAPIVR